MRKCLVLFSGGLSSTVALYWALERFDEVTLFTADFGNNSAEVKASDAIFRNEPKLKVHYTKDLDITIDYLKNSYALLAAADYALTQDLDHIVTGIKQTGNIETTHPSLVAFENLIKEVSGKQHFTYEHPIYWYGDTQALGLSIAIPGCYNALALTHTGTENEYPPSDTDAAVAQRETTFLTAGIADPLIIRAWKDRRMDLPRSQNYNNFRSGYLRHYEQDLVTFLDNYKG